MSFFKKAKTEKIRNLDGLSEDTADAFKAAGGDRSAFERLLKKYEKYVCTTVYSVIRNRDESFDVAQEVFLKVYHNIGTFKGESSFSSWLYRIAKNTAFDYLRKNKNHRKNVSLTFENDKGEEAYIEVVDTSDKSSPEKCILKKESSDILYEALDEINPQHKEIIELRYLGEYSYEEIAEILSLEPGTVKSRLFRAREALRTKLSEKNYF